MSASGAHELVAIGASWGGLDVLREILRDLPAELNAGVVIAQHRSPESHPTAMRDLLGGVTRLRVVEAGDKDEIRAGTVYLAAPASRRLPSRTASGASASYSPARTPTARTASRESSSSAGPQSSRTRRTRSATRCRVLRCAPRRPRA